MIWRAGCNASEEAEQLRQDVSLMMTQVNNCVSLASKHLSPRSDIEIIQLTHNVRQALVGDILPFESNSYQALLDRTKPEEIDATFKRAEADLQHWTRRSEERQRGVPLRVLTQEEQEARQHEEAEWKQAFSNGPHLSTCLATTFKGRRFLVTESRRFGLGPSVAMPGDKICAFFGADTPFLIRPVADPSEASCQSHNPSEDTKQGENTTDTVYELVEECYVNDLMDGKATKMENVHTQIIHLV